jgi:hypothetical protein
MIAAGRLLVNATTRWPAAADGLLLNATTRWPAKITLKVKTVLLQIGKHDHQVGPKFDFVEVKYWELMEMTFFFLPISGNTIIKL